MNNIKIVLAVTLFLSACKEQEKTGSTVSSIATGQMPALAKDAESNIHIVYGSGDSIMYTYSIEKGHSFCRR